jgi:ferrous iron transport protein B
MPKIPFFDIIRGERRAGVHYARPLEDEGASAPRRRLVIVGNPNVGKSVIFNRLTGRYVTVSNYPGTTVEIARGRAQIGDTAFEVVDTPGMYSLCPLSEEERVGRTILLNEHADVVLHVVDAKNLDRMLPFTFQLIEAGFRLVLVVNMLDEAERLGISLDLTRLARELEIPVVGTVALTGRGIDRLKEVLYEYARAGA